MRTSDGKSRLRNMKPTLAALLALVLGVGCGKKAASDGESPLGFSRDIKGILSKFCFECLGVEHKEAELDLRTVESILAGGESGPAMPVSPSPQSDPVRA